MTKHITKRVAKAIALVAISTATLYGGGGNFNRENIEISRTIIKSAGGNTRYEVTINNNSSFALKNYSVVDGKYTLDCGNTDKVILPTNSILCTSDKSIEESELSQSNVEFMATRYAIAKGDSIHIDNSNFESGTLDGWNTNGDVDTDSSSALVQKNGSLSRDIELNTQGDYSVSLAIKAVDADTKGSLSVSFLDKNKNVILSSLASNVIEYKDGKESINKILLKKESNAKYIHISIDVNEGSVLVDNLKVSAITLDENIGEFKIKSKNNNLKVVQGSISNNESINYNDNFKSAPFTKKLKMQARACSVSGNGTCPKGYTNVSIINPGFEDKNIHRGWAGGGVFYGNAVAGRCDSRAAWLVKCNTTTQTFAASGNTNYYISFKAANIFGYVGQYVEVTDNKGKRVRVKITNCNMQSKVIRIKTSPGATRLTIRIHSGKSNCYKHGLMVDCFKVCKAKIILPEIHIEKYTNGVNADTGTGPKLKVGSTVTWKYVVTNVGKVNLTGVKVTDNREGHICTIGNLAVGHTKICTKVGKVKLGQYANKGIAIGYASGKKATDIDYSHYYGYGVPKIHIEKYTNGVDADKGTGPKIKVGSTVTWKYVVKNTGQVKLTHVAVLDFTEGKINCPKNTLNPGESMTCIKKGIAKLGQYSNKGRAVGYGSGKTVIAYDYSHYYGYGVPRIHLEKYTNGVDADTGTGPKLKVGSTVTWKYIVKNIGSVKLTGVSVSDNKEGKITCPKNALNPGQSMACIKKGVAKVGQYSNVGTAVGYGSGKKAVDRDASHYYGYGVPKIHIEKYTNGVDADTGTGPTLKEGSTVTWKYIVKNIGSVRLVNVAVSDNKEGKINCPKNALNPGETITCIKKGVAEVGQYSNVGTAVGYGSGKKVTHRDASHYYGKPKIKKSSCIGDLVWFDRNRNGIQDVRERGIAGVKVELLTSNGQPVKDVNGNTVAPQTTSANGKYKFCNLDKGSYIVKVTPSSGFLISPQNQGGDDTRDSDINPGNGQTATINLPEGVNDMKWDIGLYNG